MIEKLKEHNVIDPKTDKIIGTIGCDLREIIDKLNEVVDAVNKHEDIIRQIGEWGSSKGECLWCDTLTEFNPEKPLKETFVSIDEALKMGKKVDPYEEQKKWIGKLCQFWDDDALITSNDWAFGILTSIDKGMQFQYCCNENCNFKHCQPVKPDDSIIYKGGDNEK